MPQTGLFPEPPDTLCLLRLSALGDITHVLPTLHTLQTNWPDTRITWIIGKTEHALVKELKNIEFVVFDKKAGFRAYWQLFQTLKNRHFDVLLHMQMSLRASIASLAVKAPVRLGFDRQRAKDGQWLFSNHKIDYQPHQHVVDSFFGFTKALGIQDKRYQWSLPVSEQDMTTAAALANKIERYVIISPCSSKAYRNWHTEGYSAIADYLSEQHHYTVILTGGNTAIEHDYASRIMATTRCTPLNLTGKTTIGTLLALIKKADFMISPDSGPAHMATAMNTPVIGLYACTNPDRARPYLSKKWLINRYPDAIRKKFNKTVNDVAWGTRVKDEWAMQLITVEDVKIMIDQIVKSQTAQE